MAFTAGITTMSAVPLNRNVKYYVFTGHFEGLKAQCVGFSGI